MVHQKKKNISVQINKLQNKPVSSGVLFSRLPKSLGLHPRKNEYKKLTFISWIMVCQQFY